MDLLAALKRPEGEILEFKRDLSSPDAALRTITAFANTAGGTLLVGVRMQRTTSGGCMKRSISKSGSRT